MSKKILSLIRALPAIVLAAVTVSGYLGLGLQAIGVVVLLTAYREDLARILRRALSEKHEQPPLSEHGKSVSAFHEGGHSVVGWILPGADKPYYATIQQTERTNGHIEVRRRSSDPPDLGAAIDHLALLYAGAAAEREFGLVQSAGWSSDLNEATHLAKRMVCEWGFSGKLAHRRYDTRDGLLTKEILVIINAEIDRFLGLGEELAIKTVKEHRDKIGRVAALLLQYGTLDEAKLSAAIEGP